MPIEREETTEQAAAQILEESQNVLRYMKGETVHVRRRTLERLLQMIQHLRDLAAAPRYVVVDPREWLDEPGDPRAPREERAAAMRPAREEYTCRRCQIPFLWSRECMVWLCSQAENCPLCDPLCLDCMNFENKGRAEHVLCPNSGSPVAHGRDVTCSCGAKFKDIFAIPAHKPPPKPVAVDEIDPVKEIHEAMLALESLDDGRDLTDLARAQQRVIEMRDHITRLEADLRDKGVLYGS